MSSTNKTANYELSQFIGTDKPAWLTDYNSDMSKIDAGVNTAQTTATAADGKADANTTAIGTLANLSTEAKTDLVSAINEVDTHADSAQITANGAASKATANETAINKIAQILNINTYKSYGSADATCTNGTITGGELYVARNSDGSLFKVYGNLIINPAGGTVTVTLPNTGVSSDTSYTIQGCGYCFGTGAYFVRPVSIDVDNTGALKVKYSSNSGDGISAIRLVACLYFNSDFGDITPEQ